MSVERIADLMGVSVDLLYKYLADGSMKASLIPGFEAACGCHYVTELLASGAHRLVIDIPAGRPADPHSLSEVQTATANAVAALIQFWRGEADQDQAIQQLTGALKGLAWHRENVTRAQHPELDLEDLLQ